MSKKAATKVATEPNRKSRFQKKRSELTAEQNRLLNLFWNHFQLEGKWPTIRSIHSQQGGKQSVRNHLRDFKGIAFENDSHPRCYELTILGVLLTENGDSYAKLLTGFLEALRAQYQKHPDLQTCSDSEISTYLGLSTEQRDMLGKLLDLSNVFHRGRTNDNTWNIQIPDLVEDLQPEGDLDDSLEDIIFKRFENRTVFCDEQRSSASSSTLDNFLRPDLLFGSRETATNITVDVLKRRYQVFVSSTYEDLKEERQHVIQSLLETKCIPLGMELFPATSQEQWELIKRIIFECDYYVVIIAGRYGSAGKDGVGYTEKEFDYALEIGKPVIGFYHRNPMSLPGEKLEKTDVGKKQLAAFTEKVKQRVCRPWASAAELGSAVKSAIFHELEFNPKPGWIRADMLPTSEVVEKMKQRIADLEEQLKTRKSLNKETPLTRPIFPDGNQLLELPVTIKCDSQPVKKTRVKNANMPENLRRMLAGEEVTFEEEEYEEMELQQKVERAISVSWDDFVLALANRLQRGGDILQIHEVLEGRFKEKVTALVANEFGSSNCENTFWISRPKLELALKTLMARKLVKMSANHEGNWNYPDWQFTPKGLQYLAELQAIRGVV